MVSVKLYEAVLCRCIDAVNSAGVIYQPKGFLDAFPKNGANDVMDALTVLHENGLIVLQTASLPECQNIHMIAPTAKARAYFMEKEIERKAYWKNWRWNIWAAVAVAVVSSLLGAFLARVSQIIWP